MYDTHACMYIYIYTYTHTYTLTRTLLHEPLLDAFVVPLPMHVQVGVHIEVIDHFVRHLSRGDSRIECHGAYSDFDSAERSRTRSMS